MLAGEGVSKISILFIIKKVGTPGILYKIFRSFSSIAATKYSLLLSTKLFMHSVADTVYEFNCKLKTTMSQIAIYETYFVIV